VFAPAACGGLARMVYNTKVMALSWSCRFSGGVSLLAVAVLLCLGASLSWIGPEVPATVATADSYQMDNGTNGYQLNGSYLAVSAEEAEDDDKGPVNAGLLTTLILAFSFCTAAGWLLANGREASRSPVLARRPSLLAREYRPLLGVFRL
jgi:hypothetical protein